MPFILLHCTRYCPRALNTVPLLPKYGICMLHCGAGGMSEIQSVMRTRAVIVDSGPRAQPEAKGRERSPRPKAESAARGQRPRAALEGLNQRYCPREHD